MDGKRARLRFHDRMKDAQASAISKPAPSKPHVLVLSPHAAIADGLVRLLRLDGRYDARQATTTAELSRLPGARDVRGVATVGKTHRVRLRYADAVPLSERLRSLKEFRLRVITQSSTTVQVLVESLG